MADETRLLQLPSLGPIPADDGAIQSAFEALDAQMKAWTSAMTRAERALVTRSSPVDAPPHTPESVATPVETTVPSPVREPEPEVRDEPPLRLEITQPAPGSVQAPAEGPDGSPEANNSPSAEARPAGELITVPRSPDECQGGEWTEPGTGRAAAVQPTTGKVGPSEAAALIQRQKDEALLATLDPETAQAIRVMRRLSMNQKTVSELLAEYEATKSSKPAASTKKSWFRR